MAVEKRGGKTSGRKTDFQGVGGGLCGVAASCSGVWLAQTERLMHIKMKIKLAYLAGRERNVRRQQLPAGPHKLIGGLLQCSRIIIGLSGREFA